MNKQPSMDEMIALYAKAGWNKELHELTPEQKSATTRGLNAVLDAVTYSKKTNINETFGKMKTPVPPSQAEPSAPGTPGGRFLGLLAELEKRFPDPEPISARAYEGRFLAWLDALLTSQDGSYQASGGLVDCGECRTQGCPAGKCRNAAPPAGRTLTDDLGRPNERLLELADRIDHERLWARAGLERRDWTQEQRNRCDAGVMLRRYASLLGQNCWRVYPPQSGLSFQANSLDEVIKMARKHEKRAASSATAGKQS